MPYQAKKTKPVSYQVDFTAVVTAPAHTKLLKVWLPLPQSDTAQEVKEVDLSTFPMKVTPRITRESVYGNLFAYFEFDHPEGAQVIRHRFTVRAWEMRWDIDPKKRMEAYFGARN